MRRMRGDCSAQSNGQASHRATLSRKSRTSRCGTRHRRFLASSARSAGGASSGLEWIGVVDFGVLAVDRAEFAGDRDGVAGRDDAVAIARHRRGVRRGAGEQAHDRGGAQPAFDRGRRTPTSAWSRQRRQSPMTWMFFCFAAIRTSPRSTGHQPVRSTTPASAAILPAFCGGITLATAIFVSIEIGLDGFLRHVDGGDIAAVRQRLPFDHVGIKLLPRIEKQLLHGERVFGVEDDDLRRAAYWLSDNARSCWRARKGRADSATDWPARRWRRRRHRPWPQSGWRSNSNCAASVVQACGACAAAASL